MKKKHKKIKLRKVEPGSSSVSDERPLKEKEQLKVNYAELLDEMRATLNEYQEALADISNIRDEFRRRFRKGVSDEST